MVLCGPITYSVLLRQLISGLPRNECVLYFTLLEDHCLLLEGLGDLLIARIMSNSCDQK